MKNAINKRFIEENKSCTAKGLENYCMRENSYTNVSVTKKIQTEKFAQPLPLQKY